MTRITNPVSKSAAPAPHRCRGGSPAARTALEILGAAIVLSFFLLSCQSYVPRQDLAEEYYNLGNAYFGLERYEEAANYYRRALNLSPNLERANYNLARSLVAAGDFAGAIALLEELRANEQESVRLTETLAYAELRAGERERAVELYEEVLELSPYRVNALYNLGVIARRADNHRRAAELLSRAGDAAPNDLDVQFHFGLALLATEQPERAIAALERYTTEASDPPLDRLLEIAEAYEEARYFSRALDTYSAVLDRDEQNPGALFGRARVLLTGAEEPEEGLSALRSALQAGFTDDQAISDLLARDDLLEPGRVREVLEENDALPEEPVDSEAAEQPEDPDQPEAQAENGEGPAPGSGNGERTNSGAGDVRPPSAPPGSPE